MEIKDPIITSFLKYILGGLYAGFGGVVHYLYQSQRSNPYRFSWTLLFINMIVAFFIGQVTWDSLPATFTNKGGVIMLTGFFSYPILDFFEKNGIRWIISRVFNFKDDTK